MREIKFRCFYRSIMYPVKEMSFSPDNFFSVSVIEMDLEGLGVRNVSPDSEHIEGIMQFTGLHDKNGKEIYEGDVVQRKRGHNKRIDPGDYETVVSKVVFEDGKFKASQTVDLNSQSIFKMDIEVIGNIYEHPNLIP